MKKKIKEEEDKYLPCNFFHFLILTKSSLRVIINQLKNIRNQNKQTKLIVYKSRNIYLSI